MHVAEQYAVQRGRLPSGDDRFGPVLHTEQRQHQCDENVHFRYERVSLPTSTLFAGTTSGIQLLLNSEAYESTPGPLGSVGIKVHLCLYKLKERSLFTGAHLRSKRHCTWRQSIDRCAARCSQPVGIITAAGCALCWKNNGERDKMIAEHCIGGIQGRLVHTREERYRLLRRHTCVCFTMCHCPTPSLQRHFTARSSARRIYGGKWCANSVIVTRSTCHSIARLTPGII